MYLVYTEVRPQQWLCVRVTESQQVAEALAQANTTNGYPSVVEDAAGSIIWRQA
jgi:hypothetical protein